MRKKEKGLCIPEPTFPDRGIYVEHVCTYCGEMFELDEGAKPYESYDGIVCDECYCYNHHFTCALCMNCEHEDLQHYYVILWEPIRARGYYTPMPPGLYYIRKGPYHGGSMIGGSYLFKDALIRLRDIPKGVSGPGKYPMGHLCRHCVCRYQLKETNEYLAKQAEVVL